MFFGDQIIIVQILVEILAILKRTMPRFFFFTFEIPKTTMLASLLLKKNVKFSSENAISLLLLEATISVPY